MCIIFGGGVGSSRGGGWEGKIREGGEKTEIVRRASGSGGYLFVGKV